MFCYLPLQARNLFIFYGALFSLALLLCLVFTPLVMKVALKNGFVDKPDERKMHKLPVAYGGGIAIFLSFFLTALIGLGFVFYKTIELSQKDLHIILAFLIGSAMASAIGFIDDLISMKAKTKLLAQIIAILLLIPLGVSVTFITNPFGANLIYLHPWAAAVITVFWIVGIMNAVNLLDGLDGLLGGVTAISAIVFFIVSLMKGQYIIAGIMIALAGSALGFLRYNFNPAKIFMGDTGSLFIGMLFGIASVIGGLKTTTTVAILIPFLIMGLPILDTSWAIIRRAKNRQPIFKPDKGHIHHRLLGMGLTVKQAVIIIYLINIALGITAILICRSCRI